MQAAEVFNLLKVPEAAGPEQALRKAWLAAQQTPCKDVVALALPLKAVPCTAEGFRQALADNSKGHDFVISNWYVVYVGCSDGSEWGWSKVPYDCKKRLPSSELKPLYSADEGATRFWSFRKVSNNMNKGPRIDEEGEDLSFVLPAGTCFSVFLREDSYEASKGFFAGDGADTIAAYRPVLLQLSSTNGEQAGKGNGLKLRRVVPLAGAALSSFHGQFFSSKAELEKAQAAAAGVRALSSMAKPMGGAPLLCRVSKNAFAYHDEAAAVVELHESGVDRELGSKLLVPAAAVLQALHSSDMGRALRMLNVALGHGAVTCLVVASKASEACEVVHLHVDLAEAMWLHALQRGKAVEYPTELPASPVLTMCFGQPLAAREQAAAFGAEGATHLQWYCPGQQVPVAQADGRELLQYVVFEMELAMRQMAGQREEPHKVLLMDEVAGLHYLVKAYYAESVAFSSTEGLVCKKPRMFVTWQLRPGLGVELAGGQASTRKRQYLAADEKDESNCGDGAKAARGAEGAERAAAADDSGAESGELSPGLPDMLAG